MAYDTDPEIQEVLSNMAINMSWKNVYINRILVERITKAFERHADALTKSAEASDRYASRLVGATWALVFATVVLAAAAVAVFIRG